MNQIISLTQQIQRYQNHLQQETVSYQEINQQRNLNNLNNLKSNKNSLNNSNDLNNSFEIEIEEIEEKTSSEQLKEIETLYDQTYEIIKRNELILKTIKKSKKIVKQLFSVLNEQQNQYEKEKEELRQNEIEMIRKMMELDKELNGKSSNGKYCETPRKRNTSETSESCDCENVSDVFLEREKEKKERKKREDDEKKKYQEEQIEKRQMIINGLLTRNEMILLEKETKRYCNWKVFDSEKEKWEKNSSDFYWSLYGKSHLFIIIKTTEEKTFGCYLSSQILQQDQPIFDTKSFIFTFTNGQMEKYSIIDGSYAFLIKSPADDVLFTIGKKDVTIKKQGEHHKCSCHRYSFDYSQTENESPILGKKGNFTVKQFIVVGTVSVEEWKKNDDEQRKKQREERKQIELRRKTFNEMQQIYEDELLHIQHWTKKEFGDVLFDISLDNWKMKTSILNEQIIGKKDLLFLIEDMNEELFGYYNSACIEEKYDCFRLKTEKQSFLFNISSPDRLKQPEHFEVTDVYYGGYTLYKETDEKLILLGDIELFKEESKEKCCCYQNNDYFNYHGKEKALCGKEVKYSWDKKKENCFIPKRFIVIQMI